MRALTVIKRSNQWLDDTHRAIVSTAIAPSFQIMRIIHMPLTELSGFILIEPMVNANRNIRIFQRISETKIRRRIIGWIAAENDQHVDFTSAHIRHKLLERFSLIDGICIHRVSVENRLAHVAEFGIHSVRRGVHFRREVIADNDNTRTSMRMQVTVEFFTELA